MPVVRAQLGQQAFRRRVALVLAVSAALGGAGAAVLSSADALFLSRVGARHLGTGFAVSSGLSILVLWLVGARADHGGRARFLARVSVAAGLCLAGLALALPLAPRASAAILLVAAKQITASLELIFWVLIADLFTARQARRVVPWVVVGHGVGAALGAWLVGPIARAGGAGAPLWMGIGLLCLVTLGAVSVAGKDTTGAAVPASKARERSSMGSALRVLRERPMARWLALLVMSAGVFAPMMYYLLGVSAAASYPDEVELASFFGEYRAYVQALALGAQLLVAPWVAARFGVAWMMLLSPLAALVVSLWVGFDPVLWVVLVAQGSTRIFDVAVQTPAEQLIQNLLPAQVRGRVAGLVGGLAKRSGAVVGGLLASALVIWPTVLSAALASAALLWLTVAFLLWRRFADLAVAELAAHPERSREPRELGLFRLDERGRRKLIESLASGPGPEQELALRLCAERGDERKMDAAALLLEALATEPDEPESLLRALDDELARRGEVSARAASLAEELLSGGGVAAAPLVALLGCSSAKSDRLRELADEGREGVRLDCALARQEGQSVLDVLPLAGLDEDCLLELRIELARAVAGHSKDEVELVIERLVRALRRVDAPEQERESLRSIAAAWSQGKEDAVQLLLRPQLDELSRDWRDSPSAARREAALIAGTLSGRAETRYWCQCLGDADEGLRRRAEELLREAGEAALEALTVASQSDRPRVRLAAVDILADLQPSAADLDALVERELATMEECARHARAFEALEDSRLLRRRLSERVEEAVQAALVALEARHSQSSLGMAARRLARAASERSRARAMEALDALLPRRLGRTLLASLEGTITPVPGLELAVEAELSGPDPMTRELLVRALGAEGRAQYGSSIRGAAEMAVQEEDAMSVAMRLLRPEGDRVRLQVPNTLETVVALSELALFADLATHQLEEIARSIEWASLDEGETLMSEGELADSMYFVRSGRLRVLVGGESVAELGAGEPVGELALFAEDRRSATVVALERCQLGCLSRVDLENLVDEVPGVGLALCRALSRRLQAQR